MRSLRFAVVPLMLLAFAPAAKAEVLTGEADAVSGDQAVAGRDITDLSVRYDTAGRVTGTVTLRGAPAASDEALVIVHVGTISGTSCVAPALLVGGELGAGTAASWALFDSQTGPATKQLSGTTVTLDASAPALANLPQRCVWAQTNDGTQLDSTDGWGTLAGPPEPAPTPQPAPTPTPQPPAPPVPKPVAKLAIAGVSKTVKRNRRVAVKVRVSNPGTATARKLKLEIGGARGASVSPRRKTWKKLAAGKSATATVRVRLSRRARRTTKLPVHVSAGRLRAAGAITLAIAGKRKPARPPSAKGPLAGRHFWGFKSRTDYAWENHGVYFVDDRWAYEGLPKGGLPNCTAVTEELDDDGDAIGDGCRRYTYDRASGALTVGDLRGSYKDGKLLLDEIAMYELTTPKPGTRYAVQLDHRGFSGYCGLITGCTTWHETLVLLRDGQFVRTSSTVSTIGDGSSTPFVGVINYPPDERGTYEIQSRGRMRLAYADGTVKVETVGIQRNGQGAPDPVNEGLVLDDTNFYRDDD